MSFYKTRVEELKKEREFLLKKYENEERAY